MKSETSTRYRRGPSKPLSLLRFKLLLLVTTVSVIASIPLMMNTSTRFVKARESLLQGHRNLESEEDLSDNKAQEETYMAWFLKNVKSDEDISALADSFKSFVAEAVDLLDTSSVELLNLSPRLPTDKFPNQSVLPFDVSNASPDEKATIRTKWLEALHDKKSSLYGLTLYNEGKEILFDFSEGEVPRAAISNYQNESSDTEFVHRDSSTSRDKAESSIESRDDLFQMMLVGINPSDTVKDETSLSTLLTKLQKLAVDVLGGSPTDLTVHSVNHPNGNFLVRFDVDPLGGVTMRSAMLQRWSSAVQLPAPELVNLFPSLDNTCSIYLLISTSSSSSKTEEITSATGVSPGIIAGAILGGMAAIGIVGAVGYAVQKVTSKNDPKNESAAQSRTDLNDKSPVSPDATITPNALSNVNIYGETTPNPHNYKE